MGLKGCDGDRLMWSIFLYFLSFAIRPGSEGRKGKKRRKKTRGRKGIREKMERERESERASRQTDRQLHFSLG